MWRHLFVFLVARGWSDAVTIYAHRHGCCSSDISCFISTLRWVCVSAEVAHICWAVEPAYIWWKTQGSKALCSSSSPSDKPFESSLYVGIFWVAFLFCFCSFSQHRLLWVGLKTSPFALEFRSLRYWGGTNEALAFRRPDFPFSFFLFPRLTSEIVILPHSNSKAEWCLPSSLAHAMLSTMFFLHNNRRMFSESKLLLVLVVSYDSHVWIVHHLNTSPSCFFISAWNQL